jgi:hypothetical protein
MVFLFMAGFYGYSLYKIMRKHHAIKHKVSPLKTKYLEYLLKSALISNL